MRAYIYAHANELKLSRTAVVLQAIKGLKFGKASGPNGILFSVVKHLPRCAISFLTKAFNAVLVRQHFPPTDKYIRLLPVPKP